MEATQNIFLPIYAREFPNKLISQITSDIIDNYKTKGIAKRMTTYA